MGDAAEVGKRASQYGEGRQPWDDILDQGWGPAFAAGNALKYIRRYKMKNGDDDIAKARWYWHELYQRSLNVSLSGQAWVLAHVDLISLLTPEEILLLEKK